MDIQVITDSTSYIPKEMAEALKIRIIPLSFTFGERHIRETEIENPVFFDMMRQNKEIPKSSQPPVQDFVDLYGEYMRQGKKILGIFISDKMSGTVGTARMAGELAKEKFGNCEIEVVNSKTNCMDMGYAVIKAAEAALEGRPMEEIKETVGHILRCSRFLFAPRNLDYLRKGGRIGGAQALVGNILKINPILTVNDGGEADIFDKVRTQKKAVQNIVAHFAKETESHGLRQVTVHHINEREEAEKLAGVIRDMTGLPPRVVSIGPVIGLHVGPGTIGLAYTTEREIRKERVRA